MDYKLMYFAIIFVVLLIIIVNQHVKLKKFFGRTNKIEELLQETERTRMEELHSSIEVEREKLREKFNTEYEESERLNRQRQAILDEEFYKKKELNDFFLRTQAEKASEEINKLQQVYAEEAIRIQDDQQIIEHALADLKAKRIKTVQQLKEEQKNKNELDFHKIIFTQNDLQDIKQLAEVEKVIHNKDVLRKLVYKTYVEQPMGQMFSRVGISDSPGIYKIENIDDGKVYIGQSVNVKNRMRDHIKSAVGISTIANQWVHEAMKEEGIEKFIFHLIDDCDREELNNREKYWIDYYQSNDWGYNRTRGGS